MITVAPIRDQLDEFRSLGGCDKGRYRNGAALDAGFRRVEVPGWHVCFGLLAPVSSKLHPSFGKTACRAPVKKRSEAT